MLDREAIKKEIKSAFQEVNKSVQFKDIRDWFKNYLKQSLPALPYNKLEEIEQLFLNELSKETKDEDVKTIENLEVTFIDNLLGDINNLNIRFLILEEEILALGLVILKLSNGGLMGEIRLNPQESIKIAYYLSKIINSLNDYKYGLNEKEDVLKNIQNLVKNLDETKKQLILKNLSVILKEIIEGLSEVVDLYGKIAEEIVLDSVSEVLSENLFESEKDRIETEKILIEMINDYYKSESKDIKKFLIIKFKQYPELWKGEEEIYKTVNEIMEGIEEYNKEKEVILQAESHASIIFNNFRLDEIINNFNNEFYKAYEKYKANKQGLHGYMAETWQTETFNLNAFLKGSDIRAIRLESQDKNSVDIQLVKGDEVLANYQCKYSVDAGTTKADIMERNYPDQYVIVPKDQLELLKKYGAENPEFRQKYKELTDRISTNHIDPKHRPEGEPIESNPLTRSKATELAEKVEKKEPIFTWKLVKTKNIVKYQAKQTLYSMKNIFFLNGAIMAGRRFFNYIQGKKNPPLEKDLKEWLNSSIKASVPVVQTSLITAGLILAAKKGLIKSLQNTPPGKIAKIASVALDNIKIVYKAFKGEITWREAIPTMAKVTATSTASLVGAGIGASIGSVIPVVGTWIGGFIGSLIGGFLASEAISVTESLLSPQRVPEVVKVKRDLCKTNLIRS